LQLSSTALCSTTLVMMWSPLSFKNSAMPFNARLSDSVAPEVNTISFSLSAPMSLAICSRA
jgi:hypothetical protein